MTGMRRSILLLGVLFAGCAGATETPLPQAQSNAEESANAVPATPEEALSPWDTPTGLALYVGRRDPARVTLRTVAAAQIEAGDDEQALATLKQALAAAQAIEEPRSKAYALADIGSALAEAGDKEQALAVAQQALSVSGTIDDADIRANALNRIASTLVTAGDREELPAILEQSMKAAQEIPTPSSRAIRLTQLALVMVKAGEVGRALATLSQALEVARDIEEKYQASRLSSIALAQIEAGDKEQALATVSQALEGAQEVTSNELAFLAPIASAQVRAGGMGEARDTLKQVMEVAQKSERPYVKAISLRVIASVQVEAGDKDQALATLKQAREVARGSSAALVQIANAQIVAGDNEQALVTLRQALAAVRNEPSGHFLSSHLTHIAATQVEAGGKEQGLATLRQAFDAIQRIENSVRRIGALSEIGIALATEPVPDVRRDELGTAVLRMKQSFTFEEQDLARSVVEELQVGVGEPTTRELSREIGLGTQEVSSRRASLTNLKRIALGFRSYHDRYRSFPMAVQVGPKDVPRSWRVTLLPHLGYKELHSAYRQDEPWDSEHNKTILAQMPDVYRSAADKANSTNSSYFVLTGPETVFPSEETVRYRNILDGMAYTLLVVESKRDVPWTKPEDIAFDSKAPVPELGGWYPDGFNAVTCAARLCFFPHDFDETTLKRLIMRADGQSAQIPQPLTPEKRAGTVR